MTKTIIYTSVLSAILVVVLFFGLSLVNVKTPQLFGSQVQNDAFIFTGGITVGNQGQFISKYKCYSDTAFNPSSVSTTTADQSDAFLTPFANYGDIVVASLATTTSASLWEVRGTVTAGGGLVNATTTLYMHGVYTAIDLATTTAKICIISN